MEISEPTKKELKSKAFRLLQTLVARVQSFYHDERLKFILGFTASRFSHAELYVNGQRQTLEPTNFEDLEKCIDRNCVRLHFNKVSTLMLAQMWASRRKIEFKSHSGKLEVLTFWFF